MADFSLSVLALELFYIVIGGAAGIIMMLLASFIVPKIMGHMTPNINEEKEIVRGNLAVATYYGQVTQAVIIAIGIIIAAAVIAAIL